MPNTTTSQQRWSAADLADALRSPDILQDATIVLDIDYGDDRVRTRAFAVEISADGHVVNLRAS